MILGQKGLAPLILVLVVALLAGGGFLGYQMYSSKNPSSFGGGGTAPALPNLKLPAKTSPTTQKVVMPRSKAPGIVTAALTAHGYNSKTGSAIKPDKYFAPKDPQVFLLMNVNKPKVGDRVEYVRYLQGKYLDHRSIKVAQANWKYAYFGWSAKTGKEHKKGIYRVRVYSNGVLEKKLNYIVRNQ